MKPTIKLIILAATLLLGRVLPIEAQVKITDGAVLTLDPNSLLELESTSRGLLIPRVAINNLTQAAPLTAPVPTGMMVYSLGGVVVNGFYYWNGSAWVLIGPQWSTNGLNIYYNAGNVGIGTSTPAERLEVNGDIKIGSTTTGTVRATNELVLRQDGDQYGPSILRIRNRTAENGAIFETTDGSITLIDFIFKNALNQRNIRFESRAAYARTGAPSFHLGGASPDNPTLSLGDNYAAFNKNVRIGDYTNPLTTLDVNGQITLRTGAANGAVLVSNASGTGTWTTPLPVASGGTGSSTLNFVDLTNPQTIGGAKTFTGAISASNLSGTNTGDQTITLTGNVTGSGTGSFVTTIANNAVTYGKMQAVGGTSRLLGSSSTTTPVQEITLGSGLSMAGTTLSSTGSGGTVTNFSAGDLPPLFTTTETTTTTTPALSFSFTNAGAYTIFGNNTGLGAAPAYFTPILASALFQNQGTTTGVLHGNASGNPSWGQIVNADITNASIDLTTKVTGILPVTNGGTNSSTALNNNRMMISSAGSIIEATALSNGQLLIGSNGAAPIASTLTAGTMMTVTNAAGSITVSANVANAVVASNQTTTLTTASNVTGMSFNLGANETWSYEFNLQNGCSGGGGSNWAITCPGGSTLNAVAVGNATNMTTIKSGILTVSGTLTVANFCNANLSTGWTRITGVVVNGGTAGTVQLQFASVTNGQTTTVYANSYFAARKVN